VITVLQIGAGVAIGYLFPPIGLAFCAWYLWCRYA